MGLHLVKDKSTSAEYDIPPPSFGCHTALLAQSGSGKSFLVGRLIEELLIKSKARVVVLDPNSDFVRLPHANAEAWKDPKFKPWFFKGDTRTSFRKNWSAVNSIVLSNRNLPNARRPRISWGGLTDLERADVMNIDAAKEPELYWTLVLAGDIAAARWSNNDETEHDFEHFRATANELCDFLLDQSATAFDDRELAVSLRRAGHSLPLRFRALLEQLESFDIWRGVGENEKDIDEIVGDGSTNRASARVVDLLSVNTEAERMALTTRTLAGLWRSARDAYSAALRDANQPDTRRPTFLVIDEAHNLIPVRRTSAAAERLALDVIRIAAEGRKFGLFLIVVTQRPRKLDPSVISECDNLLLMRMTNGTDLDAAKELFGFLAPAVISDAKNLLVGDVFLQGRLSKGGQVWHAAPRRTQQGGRSLDDDYWGSPFAPTSTR
jgi:hypothetical protein